MEFFGDLKKQTTFLEGSVEHVINRDYIVNRRFFIYCSLATTWERRGWKPFTLTLQISENTYGVVPKGLLTFLGSLYKEIAKTTSGSFVYRFERQTARKNASFEKHCVIDLECKILSQEPSDSCILYFNVIFRGRYAEEDINRQLVTCECSDNWNGWSFGDPVLHHPKWIQCDLLKPITLSIVISHDTIGNQ